MIARGVFVHLIIMIDLTIDKFDARLGFNISFGFVSTTCLPAIRYNMETVGTTYPR